MHSIAVAAAADDNHALMTSGFAVPTCLLFPLRWIQSDRGATTTPVCRSGQVSADLHGRPPQSSARTTHTPLQQARQNNAIQFSQPQSLLSAPGRPRYFSTEPSLVPLAEVIAAGQSRRRTKQPAARASDSSRLRAHPTACSTCNGAYLFGQEADVTQYCEPALLRSRSCACASHRSQHGRGRLQALPWSAANPTMKIWIRPRMHSPAGG